jgi:hypothetical protein
MPRKTALTLITLFALLRVPDLIPKFRDYKVFDWAVMASVFEFKPRRTVLDEQQTLRPDIQQVAAQTDGHLTGSLDRFYQALLDLDEGRPRTVRVLHYGDSPTTADMITADARILLQKRFGDAGHGYHLVARPWAWYEHRGVSNTAEGWRIETASLSKKRDGRYGLGGVSFQGEPGASARFRFRVPQEIAKLDAPPDADAVLARLDSNTWELKVGPNGARAFGVTFFTGRPGVIYDSLGLNGAYISVLAKMFNEAHWADELREADPAMVVINYGTNESMYADFVDYALEKELREVIRRIRAAVPGAAILVMSPMDRGARSATGEITTVPALQRLVTIEQRVAASEGVSFFNTFAAMGGTGTMGRWYQAEPRLVGADFIHPMPNGARIVGTLLHNALMQGYQVYRAGVMRARLKAMAK